MEVGFKMEVESQLNRMQSVLCDFAYSLDLSTELLNSSRSEGAFLYADKIPVYVHQCEDAQRYRLDAVVLELDNSPTTELLQHVLQLNDVWALTGPATLGYVDDSREIIMTHFESLEGLDLERFNQAFRQFSEAALHVSKEMGEGLWSGLNVALA